MTPWPNQPVKAETERKMITKLRLPLATVSSSPYRNALMPVQKGLSDLRLSLIEMFTSPVSETYSQYSQPRAVHLIQRRSGHICFKTRQAAFQTADHTDETSFPKYKVSMDTLLSSRC